MKSFFKIFLLTVVSLILTFSFAYAEKFEVGGEIFYLPQADNLILFGGNASTEIVPSFIFRGFGGFGSKTYYSEEFASSISITLLGGDILYRIGEGNIKPYFGAGFSFFSVSTPIGISISVNYINFLGGGNISIYENLKAFAELRYMLPLQSGFEGRFVISGGVNYAF